MSDQMSGPTVIDTVTGTTQPPLPFSEPLDSPYRCPRDGKRLVFVPATKAVGEQLDLHECWNCDYKRYMRPGYEPRS